MPGRLDEAQAALTSATMRNPSYPWAHGVLTVVHHESGDIDSARASAGLARRYSRRFSVDFAEHVLPYRLPERRRRIVEA
jgi:hypothetical protein